MKKTLKYAWSFRLFMQSSGLQIILFGLKKDLLKKDSGIIINHRQYIKNTELSICIWYLKDAGTHIMSNGQ